MSTRRIAITVSVGLALMLGGVSPALAGGETPKPPGGQQTTTEPCPPRQIGTCMGSVMVISTRDPAGIENYAAFFAKKQA